MREFLTSMSLYKRLPTKCSLCEVTLEECAMRMAPSHEYTLYVHPGMRSFASMVIKHLGATAKHHPFAPCINLVLLDNLGQTEWFIKGAYHEAWGSEGV